MARRTGSQTRAVRTGTSKAMRSLVRTCAGCDRGQNPRVATFPGGSVWQCRYCGHEHSQSTTSTPRADS